MADNFCFHIRLKVLTLDMIASLEDALLQTAKSWEIPGQAIGLAYRLRKARICCFLNLPLDDGTLQLSPKQMKRYHKGIELLKKVMVEFLGKDTIDAREFVTACTLLVEKVNEQFKGLNQETFSLEIQDWDSLSDVLTDVIDKYDPKLKAIKRIYRGEEIGYALYKVIVNG